MKLVLCHERALWPRGASHFSCFAKKSNQKKATPAIRLFPVVLAFRGMRSTSHESFADATHSVGRERILDRETFRSSGQINGEPIELIFDRVAMGTMKSDTNIWAATSRTSQCKSQWPL